MERLILLLFALIACFQAISQATRQDSIRLYEHSERVRLFYDTVGNYVLKERRFDFEAPAKPNFFARISFKPKKKCPRSRYYSRIDKNRYWQREVHHSILNTRAPMQLFHRDVKPVEFVEYRNNTIGSPEQCDLVGIYLYPKPKGYEKKEREKPKRVKTVVSTTPPLPLYDREGEIIREWESVPNTKVILAWDNGRKQYVPFAIENLVGDRIPYQHNLEGFPVGFQYPQDTRRVAVEPIPQIELFAKKD